MANRRHFVSFAESLGGSEKEHMLDRHILNNEYRQVIVGLNPLIDNNAFKRSQAAVKFHHHALLSCRHSTLNHVIRRQDIPSVSFNFYQTSGAGDIALTYLNLDNSRLQSLPVRCALSRQHRDHAKHQHQSETIEEPGQPRRIHRLCRKPPTKHGNAVARE